MKKFTLTAISILAAAATAFAQETAAPILAPVDPLAWAVANADWGHAGGQQVESLRKIVNGQVAAHQVNCSYTDPRSLSVMRVKCFDPANCVVCSKSAGEAGRKLRQEIGNSAASAQTQGSIYNAIATYAQQRATALSEQAKWNELRNENTVTETTTDGQGESQTVTKTVKVENAADKEMQRTSQILQQLAANAHTQAQQQGSMVHNYVNAAVETLQKPSTATVVLSGQDPLQSGQAAAPSDNKFPATGSAALPVAGPPNI